MNKLPKNIKDSIKEMVLAEYALKSSVPTFKNRESIVKGVELLVDLDCYQVTNFYSKVYYLVFKKVRYEDKQRLFQMSYPNIWYK